MSILIKGMKMPHSCIGCRFCEHGSINEWDLYCGIDNKHVGNWDDKHINNGWRRPDCPLVPVPTPHGRLIDGDNVINLLREQLIVDRGTVYEFYDDGLEMAISELSIVPIIIEAEE